jgi:GMP synthase (glutamine-hydrolysing)
MLVHFVEHESIVGAGTALDWARERSHPFESTRIYEGQPLPRLDAFDMLVVPGGTMSVYDKVDLPWLRDEKRFVAKTLEAGKPVVGLCLGAQMLAEVLGGRVFRAPHREFGWFEVRTHSEAALSPAFSVLPESIQAFHWHGDAFELPPGVSSLAYSDATPNQAFEYGGVAYALQFHLEVSEAGVRSLLDNAGYQLQAGPYVQAPEAMLPASRNLAESRRLFYAWLDRIADRVSGRAAATAAS